MEKNNCDQNISSRKRKKQTDSTIDEGASIVKRKKNDTSEENTKIDSLSDDILIEIIKFLPMKQWPSLEKVDRQFQRSVFGAWRTLKKVRLAEDLGLFFKPVDEKVNRKKLRSVFRKLLRRIPHISLLIFDYNIDCSLFSKRTIRSLSKFTSLQCLDFGNVQISLEELITFLVKSQSRDQLKRLKVDMEKIDEDLPLAFDNDSQHLPRLQLKQFSFTNGKSYTNRIFNFSDLTRLTHLNISGTAIDSHLISILNRSTNLRNLEFTFPTTCQPQLHFLNFQSLPIIHQFRLLWNKQLLETIAKFEQLSSLKIGFDCKSLGCQKECFGLHSELASLVRQLGRRDRVEELFLSNFFFCSEEVVLAITENLAHLKSLEFYPSKECTDDQMFSLFARMDRLQKLSLYRICTSNVIIKAMASLAQLKCLHLGSSFVESKSLNQLASLSNLTELRVWIKQGYRVTTSTMKAWGLGLGSKLETLDLSGYWGIIDKSVISFVKKTPGLLRLCLKHSDITDRCLHAIATNCSDLSEFDLSYCREVTVEGVQAIVDRCSQLKRLIIYGRQDLIFEKLKLENHRKVIFEGFYMN